MSDLISRLRCHNDERLYREADLLMAEAADELERMAGITHLESINDGLIAENERLRAALLVAVRQNEHDMLMTGDELRACRAALPDRRHNDGEQR